MSLVSIITPIKNGSNLFRSTYESVINQTYKNFEWFIIDDGSSAEEKEKIESILVDDRASYITGGHSNGPGKARNIGLKLIAGDYVSFIDSDDLWDQDFLTKSISELKKQKVSFVFAGYKRLILSNGVYLDDFLPTRKVTQASILAGSDISCLTALISRSLLTDNTKFGEIPARNDLVFFYRVLGSGDAFPISESLATYRLKKKSVSSNKLRALKYQFIVNRKFAKKKLIISVVNVTKWVFYGLRKYKS